MAFELPTLPYAYDALEPHIDARTMEIHHSKHHAWYTNKLNAAIVWTDLENTSIEDLLSDPDALPEDKKQAIVNNGGGYYNHMLFWPSLSPDGWGSAIGTLAEAIDANFGSFSSFQEGFTKKALSLFGSGWTYLCKNPDGSLCIKRRSFQETPLKAGLTPLLGLDVREHAYYLHYQNKRADYVAAWWHVINWDEVEQRFVA